MSTEILIYTNKKFKISLLATLYLLLVFNIYSFLQGNLFAFLLLFLQAALLIVIHLKWPEQRILIKFWAALLFIWGSVTLVSALINYLLGGDAIFSFTIMDFIYRIFSIIIGIYYYGMLKNYTKVVIEEDTTAKDLNQTA
jgi:membrane-bound ClpP family serine protease